MNSEKIKLSNIRNFQIPKSWSFFISSFQILTPTHKSNYRLISLKYL